MRLLATLILVAFSCNILKAQPLQKTVTDAYLVSRMVEKFHIQPRPLDDERSDAIFRDLMQSLDEQRIFFTQDDVKKLSAYRLQLDDEIKNKRSNFLHLLITTYKQRLLQADTMLDNICKKPFNFSLKEKYTVAEDTTCPADVPAMHAKMQKLLKLTVLAGLLEYAELTDPAKLPSKKTIDSLEPALRKKAGTTIKRSVKRVLQSPQGVEFIIGNLYCQALAATYDPHTAYFSADAKENFESQLGKKPLEFGVTFSEDEDGHAQIDYLKPGSSAYQSGRLNKGDKIQSIQWEQKEPIDVADAGVEEVEQALAATGGSTVNITVKKADGTVRQVALHKERLDKEEEEEEEEKVKSFMLQGDRKIGFISLPAFYSDWEGTLGINGCANDVAREIIKLKKENIEGLIIDLRYNGGGSLQEAIELSGIFIDAGPVAQLKTKAPKAHTLKDGVLGTIYDGPLVLLVNGFSASASEMVAAVMQDYNRALIVGSPTYGKATSQIVLPIDTTIDLQTYNGKSTAASYIKLTTSKLFRVNGTTAQAQGVKPDISLPDLTDAAPEREADEKYVLPASVIEPNKYYKPLPALPVAAAAAVAKKEMAESAYFNYVNRYIEQSKAAKEKKDLSLSIEEAWQKRREKEQKAAALQEPDAQKPIYKVIPTGQKQRAHDSELDEEWTEDLLTDAYVKVAFQVLATMKK
ncbi:carboxy terminal-processing peptidase [Longitalea luteola]|uniref:carboxy terminal-processing peptidase n=1 Tax=Longitalea luteola TaxID=2812563 RepID=UPI001A956EC3|nr:carboxy terminal-processing peptidase [Longitalea luteola]